MPKPGNFTRPLSETVLPLGRDGRIVIRQPPIVGGITITEYLGGRWRIVAREVEMRLGNDGVWRTVSDTTRPAPPAEPEAASAEAKSVDAAKPRKKIMPWHGHAKELLGAIRVESPHLSNGAVATEIIGRWKRHDLKCPGHRTLETFVAGFPPEISEI